jgi:hypothetical protein
MRSFLFLAILFLTLSSEAQTAAVQVSLRPAGSFVGKSSDVKGFAQDKGDHVEAHNVIVNLQNLETGINLRNEHTKKHLEVQKFPTAILVSAEGRDGKGKGIIKIKGIEKEIAGTYEIKGRLLAAQFPLKLSDFQIEGIKYMGVGVADEVQVSVEIPLQK